MKNKKIRIVIEGFIPEDFPVDDEHLTTSGSPSTGSPWRPVYVHSHRTPRTTALQDYITLSAEMVVPPEPEYKVGQIWTSAAGVHFLRADGGWLQFGYDRCVPDDYPSRPLTLTRDV